MTSAVSQMPTETLQDAIKLAQDVRTQEQAHATFNTLYDDLRGHDAEAAEMMQMLWREYVASRRSAAFWQELCQVEKHLSERITESHIQLRQNYLRLMQEQ